MRPQPVAKSTPMADGFPGERLTILPPAVLRRARGLPGARGLCVTHTGRFDHVQGHRVVRPEGTPEYVLIVCLHGAGKGHLGSVGWSLRGGQGVILPPGVRHDYAADAKNPWTLMWFHFTGDWAEECVRMVGGAGTQNKFSIHDTDMIVEAFEDCYRHVMGGYTDADLIGLTTSFARLLGLCRTLHQSPSLRRRKTENRVLRTMRYMRENLAREISLGQLAKAAGLSIPHYSAMFRRSMNCSPIEFLIRLRLQKACELIETTDRTIAEIAYAVGFTDPLYFSRVFRRHMGITASDYRVHNGGRAFGESTLT